MMRVDLANAFVPRETPLPHESSADLAGRDLRTTENGARDFAEWRARLWEPTRLYVLTEKPIAGKAPEMRGNQAGKNAKMTTI